MKALQKFKEASIETVLDIESQLNGDLSELVTMINNAADFEAIHELLVIEMGADEDVIFAIYQDALND